MMLTKSQPDEIQSFLSDASYVQGGFAALVVFPESAEGVAEILASATRERTPVTISGAGTGTVAGRVPFGGSDTGTGISPNKGSDVDNSTAPDAKGTDYEMVMELSGNTADVGRSVRTPELMERVKANIRDA